MSYASNDVYNLADIVSLLSANMHTLHLNYVGPEFDSFHKDTLKEYYERLNNDYDDLAEWGRCFGGFAPNKGNALERLGNSGIPFELVEARCIVQADAISICNEQLKAVTELFRAMYLEANKDDDYRSIGFANWLQSRIEYWSKEYCYFNYNRKVNNGYK